MFRQKNIRAKGVPRGLYCFDCKKHEIRPYERNGKIIYYKCSYCNKRYEIEDLGYIFFRREFTPKPEDGHILFTFEVVE